MLALLGCALLLTRAFVGPAGDLEAYFLDVEGGKATLMVSPSKMKYALILFYAGLLATQPFNIGVKGGVGLTDHLGGTMDTSESKRYVVGPMLTARLPLGLRTLYRPVGFRTLLGTGIGTVVKGDRGNSREFPMLVAERSGTASMPASDTCHGSLASGRT